jgi:hypothetical protein
MKKAGVIKDWRIGGQSARPQSFLIAKPISQGVAENRTGVRRGSKVSKKLLKPTLKEIGIDANLADPMWRRINATMPS